jgi:hypothetical protein
MGVCTVEKSAVEKLWQPRPQNLPRPDTTRTLPHLPGATFSSEAAVAEFEPEAADYEAVVAAYALDGDPCDLWDGLTRLASFTRDEIQWHATHRGERMAIVYDCAEIAR